MSLKKSLSQKIGFIGGGNMAKAICEGIVAKGLVTFQQIYVSGPNLDNLTWWKERNCNVSDQNGCVVYHADLIFIAVKPHILNTAASSIENYPGITGDYKFGDKLFVSILAGKTLEQLELALRLFSNRIIRVLPNTPVTVGEGCTIFTPNAYATKEDIDTVSTILSVTGRCTQVPESMMNAGGALVGCGPAFIYMVIEALADGAVKMGVPRAQATEFAAQVTLGAAKMVRDTGKHPGQLKDEVCSPGGTTIQGVYALERGGLRAAIMDAVECATKQANVLAQKK